MKKLLDHKLALVLITLVLGAALGWGLKSVNSGEPEHSHEETSASLWTCSMHPNVKLPEAGDCPICGMDLIPATSGEEEDSNPLVLKMTPEALAMAQVQTLVVGEGSAKKELTLSGKIQADERENASLTAKFPGRIDAICPIETTKRSKLFQPSLTNSSFQCAYRFSRSSAVKTQVNKMSRWMRACPRAVGVPSSLARESLYCASIAFTIKFAKMRRPTSNWNAVERKID